MKPSDHTNPDDEKICVSIFKNAETAAVKQAYTRLWIVLINRMERNKHASSGKFQ